MDQTSKQRGLRQVYEDLSGFKDFFATTLNVIADTNQQLGGNSPSYFPKQSEDPKAKPEIQAPKSNLLQEFDDLISYLRIMAGSIQAEIDVLRKNAL